MKATELAAKLLEVAATEGDFEVFDNAHFLIESADIATSEPGDFPSDWNMPKRFIQLGTAE